jgi:hypothetical protein
MAVMSMGWMKMGLVGYPIHLHPPKNDWVSTPWC